MLEIQTNYLEQDFMGQEVDGVDVAGIIARRFFQVTREIFTEHKTTLVEELHTYVVPAVWGVHINGELSARQKKIHSHISPFVTELVDIFDAMRLEPLTDAQKYVLSFLIRDAITAKLAGMIEMYKNQCPERFIYRNDT